MPTVTVKIRQNQQTQAYHMSVEPPRLPVPGTDSTTITFKLDQGTLSGWQFLSTAATDEFYGVTISGDDGTVFNTPQRTSDTQIQFQDLNSSATTYSYSVEITNPGLNLSLGVDPSIDNRSNTEP